MSIYSETSTTIQIEGKDFVQPHRPVTIMGAADLEDALAAAIDAKTDDAQTNINLNRALGQAAMQVLVCHCTSDAWHALTPRDASKLAYAMVHAPGKS